MTIPFAGRSHASHMRQRYCSPDAVIGFSIRFFSDLSRAVANRMRRLGIPNEWIGIRGYPGVDPTAFTRFPETQIGGNVNPFVYLSLPRGIALDHGILDTEHPKMTRVPAWRTSRLRDRVDAAIAHEYTESLLTPPRSLVHEQAVAWVHAQAVLQSPQTSLPIERRARSILEEYRLAVRGGFKGDS